MISDDDLPLDTGDLYHDDEAWKAYDAQDQDARRDRWTKILTAWVAEQDAKPVELLGALPLMELVDLDATLDSLRHEIRRAAERARARAGQPHGDE